MQKNKNTPDCITECPITKYRLTTWAINYVEEITASLFINLRDDVNFNFYGIAEYGICES